MIRVGYDSTTVTDIPAAAQVVGTYSNGKFAVPMAQVRARFPRAGLIRYNVTGAPDSGNALDIERFDASAAQAPGWYDARKRAGVQRPAIYASDNQALWDEVEHLLGTQRPHARIVATLDGRIHPNISYTPDAVQFLPERLAGVHVDVSLIYNANWLPTAATSQLVAAATAVSHDVQALLQLLGSAA